MCRKRQKKYVAAPLFSANRRIDGALHLSPWRVGKRQCLVSTPLNGDKTASISMAALEQRRLASVTAMALDICSQ